MDLWLSHPIEVSMDIWTLIFSLLICFVMIHQRRVLKQNNILFFFWFMTDAVYMVLELQAFRMPELMEIVPIIEILFLVATAAVLLVLAMSLRGGLRRVFALPVKEWLYIAVNMLGILFFLLTGLTLLELAVGIAPEGTGIWPAVIGFVPTVLAVLADMTYFRSLHERLRRSSPHMLYVFMIAVFLAGYLLIGLKGLKYAGGILTVGMVMALLFYVLSRTAVRKEPIIRKEIVVNEEDKGPAVPATATMELDRLDEILDIREEKEPKREPEAAQPASENTTLLDLNPHFMYNTLNSVYYLIDQDPSQAKTTVEDLSDYMKGKIAMAKTDHMIPLENEMELVRNYLAIQALRYDDLNVRYDLQSTGFLVPPLSVITLVEHAVASIISRDLENGEIKISTSQDELCNHISVAYSVKPGEHIDKAALYEENPELKEIRDKLESFCRGAMEILPESDRVVMAEYVPLKSEQ